MPMLKTGFPFLIAIIIALLVWVFLRPEKDAPDPSWMKQAPADILAITYDSRTGKCTFDIRYLKDRENRIQAQESRVVSYLNTPDLCQKATEYLTRREMASSIGARPTDDGNWALFIHHDNDFFNFADRYQELLTP